MRDVDMWATVGELIARAVRWLLVVAEGTGGESEVVVAEGKGMGRAV